MRLRGFLAGGKGTSFSIFGRMISLLMVSYWFGFYSSSQWSLPLAVSPVHEGAVIEFLPRGAVATMRGSLLDPRNTRAFGFTRTLQELRVVGFYFRANEMIRIPSRLGVSWLSTRHSDYLISAHAHNVSAPANSNLTGSSLRSSTRDAPKRKAAIISRFIN